MSATACKTKAPATTLDGRAQTRAWLLNVIMTGAGAWTREARVLLALAEQRGITLDEKALMNADVRDLQRWQARLCERPQGADINWCPGPPDDGSGREGRSGSSCARRNSPHFARPVTRFVALLVGRPKEGQDLLVRRRQPQDE